jgi:chromosome segregation ATPase
MIAAWSALIGAIGGILLGVLGYRRSRHVDAVSEKSGVATETRAGTAQVIDGLMALLDQVQEDNRDNRIQFREVRDAVRQAAVRLAEVTVERDLARQERDEARRELAIFRQRFGEIENGPPAPRTAN